MKPKPLIYPIIISLLISCNQNIGPKTQTATLSVPKTSTPAVTAALDATSTPRLDTDCSASLNLKINSSEGVIFHDGRLTQIGAGEMNFIDWSPDRKSLAIGTETGIRLLDAITLRERTYIDTKESIHQIIFSPNGELLATNHHWSSIRIWDIKTGTLLTTLASDLFISPIKGSFPPSYKTNIEFSPDSTKILSSTTSSVQLWDIRTQTLVHEWKSEKDKYIFPRPTFSRDGKWVASNWNKEIRI